MKITKTFYTSDRKVWRKWLEEHSETEKEVWLVYYRKQSGKARISYNDAVEEALCFGWIDSTVKTYDAERTVQKFSPRKPNSTYSQPNKERLQRLIKQHKVSEAVLATLGDITTEGFTMPDDILQALKANPQAWENFQRYSGSYQRIRIAYIESARRRPGEFEKRLKHFLEMTEKNKQFGFGIETYF
ncbi:MAG TPA: YdeI/OmpD-associated family protein [Anaerolineae bacterium]|nr:YdeI/OmpD-associated family protein [Anaerolineae bacterium]HQI87130.1 YdeI/OmpD-associated family protein [Anaerolineae bacterium]